MKIASGIILMVFLMSHGLGADPISVDEFKKITNKDERWKIIQQAPPEQKEELKRIDLHIVLVERAGGEAGLNTIREIQAAAERGFSGLEAVFAEHPGFWSDYIADVIDASEKAGVTKGRLGKVEETLIEQRDAIQKQSSLAYLIIYNLAASPRALELEKRAEKLVEILSARIQPDASTPHKPITTKERVELDKKVNQIYEEMKKLPRLSPEQAGKECDAMTDDKIKSLLPGPD